MSSEHLKRFKSRVFMVRYYEDEYQCIADMQSASLMQQLATMADAQPAVVRALSALYGSHSAGGSPANVERAHSTVQLIEQGVLSFAFVIAGQGPQAFGMPEMFAPSQNLKHHSVLERYSILMTDGRYSGVTKGPCLGHVTPEAWSGGGIGVLQDGDLLCLQLLERRIDWIETNALCAGNIQAIAHLPSESRSEVLQQRKVRMVERRRQIASCNLMDDSSDATFGAVPGSVHRAAYLPWSANT